MSARDFCTVTASTKRNADLGSGRVGAAVTYLASLLITPLWPVDQQTVRAFDLNSPRENKQCYHVPLAGEDLPDVVEGDILVVGSVEYPVQHVSEWTDGDVASLYLIVQEVKGT